MNNIHSIILAAGLSTRMGSNHTNKVCLDLQGQPVICRALAVQPWDLIPFSSVNGTGRDQLLERLEAIIAPPQE